MSKLLFVGLVILFLASCSNQSLYDTSQNYQKQQCMKDAQTGEEHEKCINQQGKSFKEYEKERQQVIENK